MNAAAGIDRLAFAEGVVHSSTFAPPINHTKQSPFGTLSTGLTGQKKQPFTTIQRWRALYRQASAHHSPEKVTLCIAHALRLVRIATLTHCLWCSPEQSALKKAAQPIQ